MQTKLARAVVIGMAGVVFGLAAGVSVAQDTMKKDDKMKMDDKMTSDKMKSGDSMTKGDKKGEMPGDMKGDMKKDDKMMQGGATMEKKQ